MFSLDSQKLPTLQELKSFKNDPIKEISVQLQRFEEKKELSNKESLRKESPKQVLKDDSKTEHKKSSPAKKSRFLDDFSW